MLLTLKRFFTVSLIALLTLVLSTPSTLAYEGGYLHGKVLDYYNSGKTTTTVVTDGNPLTGSSLLSSSKYVSYTFSQPVDIKSFAFEVNKNAAQTAVTFYGSPRPVTSQIPLRVNDLPNMCSHNLPSLSGSVDVDYQDVYTVTVHTTSSDNVALYEFDVFVDQDFTPPANVGSLRANGSSGIVELEWNNPNDADFSYVTISRDGSEIATNVTDNYYYDADVQVGETYTYTVYTVDTNGNTSLGRPITVTVTDDDLTAPSEITQLTNIVTEDSVSFNFTNPTDDDFSKVNVYQNGILVGDSTDGTYTALNLTSGTTYVYTFKTVDTTGNESPGLVSSITTLLLVDDLPPSAPTGLTHIVGNGSVTLDWNNNKEPDLSGYNVYLDGQKVNTTPLRNSYYVLNSLTNEMQYSVGVTAVDMDANESPMSSLITVTPSSTAMPVLSIGGYDLKDISDGVSGWFGALWLIIAFAVSIPLAFYVSNRVKLLFLS